MQYGAAVPCLCCSSPVGLIWSNTTMGAQLLSSLLRKGASAAIRQSGELPPPSTCSRQQEEGGRGGGRGQRCSRVMQQLLPL